ncbi:unnamed protein product, partial [Mesorhabditis belari]|uniref:F-box domain-containing protein n=1 Tax=Mesorhabditis belari TaxID=2138241 RepID=A0AAF3EKX5_9BILA
MSIYILDSDCLSIIFHYLHFAERVKFEAVCRKWRGVLLRYSINTDIRSIDISKFLKTANTDYYQQDSLSFEPTTIGILERCGPYLEELSLGGRWMKITQGVSDTIASYCYRLRVLDLGAVIIHGDISAILEEVADNLEVFSLEDTSWVDPNASKLITRYFDRMKKLRRLNMRAQSKYILNQLHDITGTLQSLDISTALREMSNSSLLSLLGKQQKLKELFMYPSPVLLNDEMISMLVELKELKTLRISHVPNDNYIVEFLGQIEAMKELKLREVRALTEEGLQAILSNLQKLKILSIAKCQNVFGFNALDHCHSLVELEITDNSNLIDEDLFSIFDMGLLKILRISRCNNVSHEAIMHALQRNQIETLDLTGSTMMTDEVLFAIASTQQELSYLSVNGCPKISRLP